MNAHHLLTGAGLDSEPPPDKKEAAPAKGTAGSGEHEDTATRATESQDSLAGRLLMLRRILLTAVELIEGIVLPTGGSKP